MNKINNTKELYVQKELETILTKDRLKRLNEIHSIQHLTAHMANDIQLYWQRWIILTNESLEDYCNKKNIKFNTLDFSVLALEVYLDIEWTKTQNHLIEVSRPALYSGAGELLSLLSLIVDHDMILEEIKIAVSKNPGKRSKQEQRKAVPLKYKFNAIEVLRFLSDNLKHADMEKLKFIVNKEEENRKALHQNGRKTESELRKIIAEVLCDYLNRYSDFKSVRQKNILVGRMIFEMDNFANRRSDSLFKTEKEFETFLADNMKKIFANNEKYNGEKEK